MDVDNINSVKDCLPLEASASRILHWLMSTVDIYSLKSATC